jgi:hypothetical protein
MFCGLGSKEVIKVLPGCAEATSPTKAVNVKSAIVRMASEFKKKARQRLGNAAARAG